jgi:lipoprotein-anchoring transpeptidase ErfK/SrfK
MFRKTASALALSASFLVVGFGSNASAQYATQASYNNGMGGGFIEFLFSGPPQQTSPYQQRYQTPQYAPQPYQPQPQQQYQAPYQRQPTYQEELEQQSTAPASPDQRAIDPKFMKQMVAYDGREGAGTIVIDTPNKFLYLVQGDGRALRYGIGVGRPGFTWSGMKTISMKKEWPTWTPPPEMLKRRPDLPRFMEGGPENPLGARAMYLGSSLYRIHGSNEPWTIGTQVSSGCIRMRNEDVIDLYNRVKVGTRVMVI